MKRPASVLLALLGLLLFAAAPAHAAFGFKDIETVFEEEDGSAASLAGSHPYSMTTTLSFNTVFDPDLGAGTDVPDQALKDLFVDLPPGLVADPTATARCTGLEFAEFSCPDSSVVGVVEVTLYEEIIDAPVYSIAPPPGMVAKLGFFVLGAPVTIELGVSEKAPYRGIAHLTGISQIARVYGSKLTVWGYPSAESHDTERGDCLESGESCPVERTGRPFLTLPRSCTGPLRSTFEADSWQNPGAWVKQEVVEAPGMSGCEGLDFGPEIFAQPTSTSAESPSGLNFDVDIDDPGLRSPTGTAESDALKTVVTLPEGVTISTSQAEGLGACTEADLARETSTSDFGQGCPANSKIGTVEVESPLLEGEVLKGSLFVAAPYENRFGSLVAIYMTIKDADLGIAVSLAGKVEPDARSGQLVTTFDDLPQLPFSHFRLRFRDGGRSPLVTPPRCGSFTIEAQFTPWADPAAPLLTGSTFPIASGIGGGPCPTGIPPFGPGFEAGSIDNTAAAFSPFYMRLSRSDGQQEMTRFSAILPPGLYGKIAGLAKCSDGAIASARSRAGRDELAAPSCPQSSQVGRVLAGAGVGPELTYVPGKLYLAGPFGGDPLSIVAIVPAVAGPFDIGTVVTRVSLTVNPSTAEAEFGAASDPIPHILEGIPLKARDIRAYADRDEFTLNPTSCTPFQVRATIFGAYADVFNSADDVGAPAAVRYQAANCARLAFRPKLSLRLEGGTRRGDHPALRAVFRTRPGDANVGKAIVTLPHSAFLAQEHIGTICTRVRYAAGNCPKRSIYGKARAFTPLLDEPLEGPVYLRSSSNDLPDLVAALHGVVDVDLVGRIDAVNARIRSSFESVPDAPVTKFVLEMKGGKKSLIVNSRRLCAHESTATAIFGAQNGRSKRLKPVVKADCRKGKPKRRGRGG